MDTETLILSNDCSPLLIRNAISDWPARKWTPEYLATQLQTQTSVCKLAPVHSKDNLWETQCEHKEISLLDFVNWLKTDMEDKHQLKGDNPLHDYDRKQYSCYLDYKYMAEMFVHRPELLEDVQWKSLGLGELDGRNSTIWIGSEGCFTNCHYDTYGFNVVAQIYGRKRWTLFPPTDTGFLYPTRIPYEESSVFSDVNIGNPDLVKHRKFKFSHPHVVTLEPGDVLYVPRLWWHYVECLEPAISINTWVDMEEDKQMRTQEAVTMTMMSSFLEAKKTFNDENSLWLNPDETVWSPADTVMLLNRTLSQNSQHKAGQLGRLAQFARHFKSVIPKSSHSHDCSVEVFEGGYSHDKSETCSLCGQILPTEVTKGNLHKRKRSTVSSQQPDITPSKNRKIQVSDSNAKNVMCGISDQTSHCQRGVNINTAVNKTSDRCSQMLLETPTVSDVLNQYSSCEDTLSDVLNQDSSCENVTGVNSVEVLVVENTSFNSLFTTDFGIEKDIGQRSEFIKCSDNELENERQSLNSIMLYEKFVKHATHPDVIKLIVEKIKQDMTYTMYFCFCCQYRHTVPLNVH